MQLLLTFNQPKSKILFHKKNLAQDFFTRTLDVSSTIVKSSPGFPIWFYGKKWKLLHKSLRAKSPSNGDPRREIPFAKEKSASSGRNPRGTRIAERTAKWESVFECLLRSFFQFHFLFLLRADTVKSFIETLLETHIP